MEEELREAELFCEEVVLLELPPEERLA